jgi:UDP-4-amino-4-deoxy-L-arabinose formyltransferase/UDP-glucuronic acid dehydrogenase (UDP-4-keto-hexauronic acid decarboxylating)
MLYRIVEKLLDENHEIVGIVSAKESLEDARTVEDFETLANHLNVPFLHAPKLEAHRDELRSWKADVGVSLNFPTVLSEPTLKTFPLGVLNVHGGDLPRYRGNACAAWAILNGESKVGLCVHKMEGDRLDSGDIISRATMKIDLRTKITAILHWMTECSPGLVSTALARLSENPDFILEKQSEFPQDALRCYPRLPEDGKIVWAESAVNILRLINAHNRPYSGAYADFSGSTVTIWDADLEEDGEVFFAVPGQVLKIFEDSVVVACGASKLRIHKIAVGSELMNPVSLVKSSRQRFR